MTADETNVLRRFKSILAQRLPAYSLIAFGSRARGDADIESDLDVLVLVDGEVDDAVRRTISDCAWEASFDSGIVLSPLAVSRQEWEHGPDRDSLLALAVRREGISV
jgi:predicted nucleotidyltransferase